MKNKFIFLLLLFLFTCNIYSTIRYVSKTGSSTPPYLTWETASDSIQKCTNICFNGDTVIVANGVYKEFLLIDSTITLLGSSMDSCIIDGTGLSINTVRFLRGGFISGFNIIGKEISDDVNVNCIVGHLPIENCRISNCYNGIYYAKSSFWIKNVFMDQVKIGVYTFCMSDTCHPKLYNSVIIVNKNGEEAWLSYDGGQPTMLNNIFVTDGWNTSGGSAAAGIDFAFRGHKTLILKNNLFSGFARSYFYGEPYYSAEITNNIFANQGDKQPGGYMLMGLGSIHKLRNNIIMNCDYAMTCVGQPDMDYNIFWNNNHLINSPYQLGEHDQIIDPMIVKDTLGYTFLADYHLQAFSPAIDAGDPEILDADGSRSDIGLYGGPLGQSYQYMDLPPSVPKDFMAGYDTSSRKIILSWRMNTENDFMQYNIYRSDSAGFNPDSSNLYSTDSIAFFTDTSVTGYEKLYYRITSVDSQLNESQSGQLISVTISGVDDIPQIEVITDYCLYQNYPNPFNSMTKINYGLKGRGYVKLMVYTLTGELALVIVNGQREAGFYETTVDMDRFSSGIYLYRIEVIGDGGIPKYMDMKKMVHLK